jgi:hypothetical protein
MQVGSPDCVQNQLAELAQHVDHVIQACNEDNELLEEEFGTIQTGIETQETRLRTEWQRIDSEVSGVET